MHTSRQQHQPSAQIVKPPDTHQLKPEQLRKLFCLSHTVRQDNHRMQHTKRHWCRQCSAAPQKRFPPPRTQRIQHLLLRRRRRMSTLPNLSAQLYISPKMRSKCRTRTKKPQKRGYPSRTKVRKPAGRFIQPAFPSREQARNQPPFRRSSASRSAGRRLSSGVSIRTQPTSAVLEMVNVKSSRKKAVIPDSPLISPSWTG